MIPVSILICKDSFWRFVESLIGSLYVFTLIY